MVVSGDGDVRIPVADHLAYVLASVSPLSPVRLALDDARGLVLAEALTAATHIPPFDNSAMDGYAVHRADLVGASADSPVVLTVIADLAAGTAEDPRVGPGEAARIMTGAPVPGDTDSIVPLEHTDRGTIRVTVYREPAVAAHVRRAGEDSHASDTVLAVGAVLSPSRIGAAASAGVATVLVHPRPRVAVLSTGSELMEPGIPLLRGQIPDSNSYALAAAVAELGCAVTRVGAVPDDADRLREVIAAVAGSVDVVILSGGASVGAHDVVKSVLSQLDTMRFVVVAMQPGKPQGFGRLPAGPVVFALPGNPVAAFVSFEVFVRPALLAMAGWRDLDRPTISATASVGWRSPVASAQYMPVVIEGAGATVRPAAERGSGSHLVASLGAATGLAVVAPGVDLVRVGDTVTVSVLPT